LASRCLRGTTRPLRPQHIAVSWDRELWSGRGLARRPGGPGGHDGRRRRQRQRQRRRLLVRRRRRGRSRNRGAGKVLRPQAVVLATAMARAGVTGGRAQSTTGRLSPGRSSLSRWPELSVGVLGFATIWPKISRLKMDKIGEQTCTLGPYGRSSANIILVTWISRADVEKNEDRDRRGRKRKAKRMTASSRPG